MPGIRLEDVIRSKDEFAEVIASFVRDCLDEVGTEFPSATVGIRWRKYFVFVAVRVEGDFVDEPSDGHPTIEPSSN